jgi:hypothetical protein
MMVGHAVEVSKHHRLSRGIYGAHAPENWCGGTPSRVTTRIEDLGGIKQFRLSRRDRWCKVDTTKTSPVNKAQRDRRIDAEMDPPAHDISAPNG